jgi:protein-L-isoaspartate(D-aspartate) O-methyltransferase
MNLIDSLIKRGYLKTQIIIEALQRIKREDFVPKDMKDLAEVDEALPVGFGQSISQPAVVAFMLENLQPKPGQKILDIGSGSGWTASLLAEIVKPEGKVIAMEIISELKDFGKKNASKYNFIEGGILEFICADGSRGWEKEAPFDGILVSAAIQKEIPEVFRKQLKIGGRIVASVKNSIWVIIKKSENDFEKTEYPGFIFVPLIEE